MSPYRVLVKDDSGNNIILAAMLSVNRATGAHTIYIIDKLIPELLESVSVEDIAYKMTNHINSVIRGKYQIEKNLTGRKYTLLHVDQINPVFAMTCIVSESERTQAKCLVAAMEDYCKRAGLILIRIL